MSLKLGELFSGYGGLGIAVEEVLGAELEWYAELDPAPSNIMTHHWPDLTNYGDVTAVDWASVPSVDIISGGSPCQDLSLAGARKGMNDGTRSNLWESMREAIATIKPTYVVWENVTGATSATANSDMEFCPGCMGSPTGCNLRALGRVLGDISDLGFNAEWRTVSAAKHAGALHGRARVFLLAYARGLGSSQGNISAGHRPQSNHRAGLPHKPAARRVSGINWGKHRPYIERWERIHGHAPSPFEFVGVKPRPSARFVEWLMGLPAGWVTEVPGVSYQGQWRAIGNGVMPQQAAAALRHMLAASQAAQAQEAAA